MSPLTDYTGIENFILITLDSCRWDTFQQSNSRYLHSTNAFKLASSHGTFTLSSHISMFSGIFPHVNDWIPYYNRFLSNLFWIIEKRECIKPYMYLPPGCLNIIEGLKEIGYYTIGTGAVDWFKSPILTSSFNEFYFSGIYAQSQIEWVIKKIEDKSKFFAFINFGETHDPYLYGGLIKPSLNSRQRMRNNCKYGFDKELFEKQILSVEFLDKKIEELLSKVKDLSKKTVVIITSDHGECFGEDNYYGHGFYHPKIMEVPLAMYEI